MTIQKLSSTDAFVVYDLPDAPAVGVVRSAPKILQAGAEDMARSLTYAFAAFGIQRGGASAGVNAAPEARDEAVAAFVTELTPLVAEGRLALDAAKGVDPALLAPLTDADDRDPIASTMVGGVTLADHLAALGPVVAAERVVGSLDGATVAIEGFGDTGPAMAAALAERGARLVAVSTANGALVDDGGLAAGELAERWITAGDAMVGDEPAPAWKVFATKADVLLAGSKMGAVNHQSAEKLSIRTLVPHAAIPYTTRALAVLQRAGVVVLPDFVPTAGPIFAWYPDGAADTDAVIERARTSIVGVLDEVLDHADGPFLGACLRAEAFLRTWQDSLPFGRPLAA